MKKAMSVILSVLLLASCFALPASAANGDGSGYLTYQVMYPEGHDSCFFNVTAIVSGKHTIEISHSGPFEILSYQIIKYATQEVIASHDSFPETAQYDWVEGEIYSIYFTYSSENTAQSKVAFHLIDPERRTMDAEFAFAGDISLYFPACEDGKYHIRISETGTYDLLSCKVVNEKGEVLATYDSFPESMDFELDPEGEYCFIFNISRNTSNPVNIVIAFNPPHYWWEDYSGTVQWILKYLLFGWLWMNWF